MVGPAVRVVTCFSAMLFSYADDCTLFYEITDENARSIVAQANSDLKQLEQWGVQWLVSFEPTKTHIFVASRKSKENTFDPSGISFMGNLIEQVKDVKIVGFIFDEKMTMEKMLKHVSKKAKIKFEPPSGFWELGSYVQSFCPFYHRIWEFGILVCSSNSHSQVRQDTNSC